MKKARRRMAEDEYRAVRDAIDGKLDENEPVSVSAPEAMRLLRGNFVEQLRIIMSP